MIAKNFYLMVFICERVSLIVRLGRMSTVLENLLRQYPSKGCERNLSTVCDLNESVYLMIMVVTFLDNIHQKGRQYVTTR